MKANFFLVLAVAAMLTASSAKLALSFNNDNTGYTGTKAGLKQTTAVSGKFRKASHATQGNIRVITEKGQRYLEFDNSFKTDFGPDLFVLLHKSSSPQGYKAQDYLSLGRLKKTSGTQRYLIPNNVNLSNYRSAVVWCRLFNVTFGYAPLNS